MPNKNAMFFNKGASSAQFEGTLEKVQRFMSEKYAALLAQGNDKSLTVSYISQFLTENSIMVEGMEQSELVERLYREMVQYSFLTPYIDLNITDVEEININSWDDVKISYGDGRKEAPKDTFLSPKHAADVVRRLLSRSGIILDNAKPCVRGHLNKKIRITVMGPGVIDEDVGISASIRFINPKKLGRSDFIRSGMASAEMLDFLSTVLRYKESICLAGEVGTGKTTVMSWILSTLPDNRRIYTIENGTREFDLVKRDKNGHILNNIVHTTTRYSDDPKQNVDQHMLLEQCLTFNPDYVAMAETKGSEAYVTQEAARTGPGVITTTHAKSIRDIYPRLVDLCQLTCAFGEDKLLAIVEDAFPITFFIRQMEDNVRRITEIAECEPLGTGKSVLHILYRFKKTHDHQKDGQTHIEGYFEQVEPISGAMAQRLRDKGMPEADVQKLLNVREDAEGGAA